MVLPHPHDANELEVDPPAQLLCLFSASRIDASMHLSTVVVPRRFRFRFCDIRDCRWLVPAERCFALPEAVNRKRFLVPLWVFCFGMNPVL